MLSVTEGNGRSLASSTSNYMPCLWKCSLPMETTFLIIFKRLVFFNSHSIKQAGNKYPLKSDLELSTKAKSKCSGFHLVNFLSHGPRPHRAASLCCALCNPSSDFPISTKTQTGQAKLSSDIKPHGFVQIIWILSPQSPFLIFPSPLLSHFPLQGTQTSPETQAGSHRCHPSQHLGHNRLWQNHKEEKWLLVCFFLRHVFALISSKSLSMSIQIQPAHGNSVLNKADQVQTEQKKLLPYHMSSPEVAAAHFPWDTGSNWKPKGQAS